MEKYFEKEKKVLLRFFPLAPPCLSLKEGKETQLGKAEEAEKEKELNEQETKEVLFILDLCLSVTRRRLKNRMRSSRGKTRREIFLAGKKETDGAKWTQ